MSSDFPSNLLPNEPDEDEIDSASVSLQRFRSQEHHESLPNRSCVSSDMSNDGFGPENRENAWGKKDMDITEGCLVAERASKNYHWETD